MSAARIEPLGDRALLVRLGDRIDEATNRRALALAAVLRRAALPGIVDVAPAYASVCVRYDVAAFAEPAGAGLPYDRVVQSIDAIVHDCASLAESVSAAADCAAVFDVPVCYGGEFGADLEAVAAHAGLAVDAVIACHTQATYRVAMLGFMPGFAYLLGLDPALQMPRRASPRTRVPAGSVGIGGAQTGIYPRELPGGWQLIGRTPLALFDPLRAAPALLEPGQRVRFRAIRPDEFAALVR